MKRSCVPLTAIMLLCLQWMGCEDPLIMFSREIVNNTPEEIRFQFTGELAGYFGTELILQPNSSTGPVIHIMEGGIYRSAMYDCYPLMDENDRAAARVGKSRRLRKDLTNCANWQLHINEIVTERTGVFVINAGDLD